MRIEAVKAGAFGPFTGDTLELAPGMNVIYGPNESGKSSWHAAIYAALCGMKRTRGQPTREDRAFASRHRPWRGTTWRVSAVVALDDGRTIEIEQSFGSGGRSVATDLGTKKPLTGDIVRAGAVDAATLLGLTRETALATLFVRQADMLRVLTEAGALQEYLERAAATSTVDTTADEALARIAAYRRDRVGLFRAGSRGPLASASRQLKEARDALDKAEERFESYQELLARRHIADGDVRDVEQRLRDLVDHEQERQRRERWQEIRAAERRLQQARQLAQEAASGPQDSGPVKELVTAVTRALAAFEARPAEPPPLEGPTADELERDLAELPDLPDGDVEPDEGVTTRRHTWQQEIERLAAHVNNKPDPPEAEDAPQQTRASAAEIEAELAALPGAPAGDVEPAEEVTTCREAWQQEVQRLAAHDDTEPRRLQADGPPVPSSELRRLADELETPLPVANPSLQENVRARRAGSAQPVAAQRLVRVELPASRVAPTRPIVRIAIILGAVLALLGVVLVAVGQPLPGSATLVLGIAMSAAAFSRWRRPIPAAITPTSPGEQPTQVPDLELQRLEARMLLEQEAVAQAARRRDTAVARLAVLNLPGDPAELRQLASTSDAAAFERERATEWERRRGELEAKVATAAQQLRATVTARGTPVADRDDIDRMLQRYAEACRQRAHQAGQAARRADVEARLRERRAAEAARSAAVERVAEWERRRGELEGTVATVDHQLRTILAARGTAVSDQDDLDQAFQRYVEACRNRAQQAGQAARRADLEARLRERRGGERAQDIDRSARATAEQQLLSVAAEAGQANGTDPEQLASTMRGWLTTQEGLAADRQRKAERVARLDQVLDGRTPEELEAEIAQLIADAGGCPPDAAPDIEDRSEELDALQSRARQRREALSELVGQIEGAEGHLLDVSQAVEAEARSNVEVQRLTALAEDLDIATEILGAAQQKVHADIAPVLNETIRPWVPRITRGRYDDIRVDPATLELEAHEVRGQFRPATVLSHGTTEQLFLLLRLALAERLATTGESAPIVLDDITVQSDADRTIAALDLLHDLSAEHQIVLFSQEDEVLRWAEAELALPSDRLLRLPEQT